MRSGIVIQLIVVVLCAGITAGQPEHVFYVDALAAGAGDGSSWSDAFVHLQDALAAAAAVEPPVEIRVARGMYRPDQGAGVTPGDQAAAFQLLEGLTLRGGYAGATSPDPDVWDPDRHYTILTGDLSDLFSSYAPPTSDNSAIVVRADLEEGSVTLEGLTVTRARGSGVRIKGGDPILRQCRFVANGGTGLSLRDANDVVVAECTFNANRTGMDNDANNTIVTDCTFESNTSDGLFSRWGNALLTDCRFIANGWAGIDAWATDLALSGCVFQGNAREGLDCGVSDVTLRDCTFTDNGDVAIDARGGGMLGLLRCSFSRNAGGIDSWEELTARACTFTENRGRGGAIRAARGATLVDCQFIGNSSEAYGGAAVDVGGDLVTVDGCLFSGNHNAGFGAGALHSFASVARLSNCLFAGNSCAGYGPGAVMAHGPVARAVNCTFADNRGQPNAIEIWPGSNTSIQFTQCILWDGPDSFTLLSSDSAGVTVRYCNVQGGYPGQGNVFVDPCFVAPGYWADPGDRSLAAGPDEPNAVWVAGDYHLKSQAGHWNEAEETWVFDDVTSLCIDLGDPNGPLGAEPFPNGGYVNLGAYGGTAEASRSYFGEPVCETQIAGDINGDCQVDDLDMDIMLSHWLMEGIGRANVPPTITIISPQDGAELSRPEPLVLRFEASDPDGRVIRVSYVLEHDHGNGTYGTGGSTTETEDGWVRQHGWSHIRYDGVYVLRAEALDDDGDKAVAEITITLHR